MDWGRNAYKTRFRPWEDSEEESTLEWVEALPDAPTINQWSAIGMTIWDRFPPPGGVGEVTGAYKSFTGRTAPEGLDGSHVCATAHEIEFGGKYLPDDPPAAYDDLGFLECCEVPDPPPPVVPISLFLSCFQALDALLGITYDASSFDRFPGTWFCKVPVVAGQTYHFTWSPLTEGTFTMDLYAGNDCNSLFWLVHLAAPDVCHTFVPPHGSYVWVGFNNLTVLPGNFTMRLRFDPGSCP